ncbi:MAG: metallophosphoesterase [Spirochaetales bacterium]|nr:metallophosphoesterase [Spirochaetales bacterium]
MKLLCITDIHGDNAKIPFILKKEANIDLVVLGGDITHLGGYKEAKELLRPLVNLDMNILAVHGNMDKEGVLSYLEEQGLNIHGKCVVKETIAFIGLGGSNPTPFHTPHEYSDTEAYLILKKALSEISMNKTKVFISHAPPKNTRLDITKSGMHVGSELVRDIIKNYSIDLCLCGHIHESSGIDHIGDSLCVNTGALRDGNYVIIDIIEKSINVTRRKI